MAKKSFIGEDGKEYVEKVKNPFYKRVWFWILIVVVVVFFFAALGGGESSTTEKADGQATNKVDKSNGTAEKNNLLSKSSYKKIATNAGAGNATLDAEKTYTANWSDNSWSGLNISVDKVQVIKVSNFKNYSDETYQGFIIIHFILDNTQRDLSVYPEQATVNTNTGIQVDGMYEMDQFAGDLLKGSKVEGYAAFPLKELKSVDDITSIRVKFHAMYSTDDYNDDNSNHDYDFSLDLK